MQRPVSSCPSTTISLALFDQYQYPYCWLYLTNINIHYPYCWLYLTRKYQFPYRWLSLTNINIIASSPVYQSNIPWFSLTLTISLALFYKRCSIFLKKNIIGSFLTSTIPLVVLSHSLQYKHLGPHISAVIDYFVNF